MLKKKDLVALVEMVKDSSVTLKILMERWFRLVKELEKIIQE